MRRAIGLIAALAALWATPVWAKPPVWAARGAKATVVLFGSVHILPQDLDWEPEALKDALKGADELWFETPIDPASLLEGAKTALARGMLPPDQSLSGMLPAATRQRLEVVAQSLNLPVAQLDRLRPWLAELTIDQAAYARDSAYAADGVERQLAAAAPQAARHAFETQRAQIAMFADAPTEDQIASLEESLREIQDDPGAFRRLMDDWMRGDLRAIERDGIEPLRRSSPTLFKILLTDRNAAWVKTLRRRLERRGKVVVIVGVGHLIGQGGVPQLLRAGGVRVDGPKP
jgi:uncharacterized protein YbaP (TraB family)